MTKREHIYADHAASAPLRPEALAAMEPYLRGKFSNPSARYTWALEVKRGVELARRTVAECMSCQPEEIYFTSGGSEGNTWAVWNAVRAGRRRVLLTTPIEHHSIQNARESMEPFGLSTVLMPVDGQGRVDPAALEELLTRTEPALVSVQWANNEVGTVQDMTAIARLCQRRSVSLHTDAVQAVGHIPTPTEGIDYLTASSHKFGGPKGTGFFFVRRGSPLRPLIFGGSQEAGMRGGTSNPAAIAGTAAALEAAVRDMKSADSFLRREAEEFRAVLRACRPDVRFNGTGDGLPGLVSVTVPGQRAEALVYRMDMAGVYISAGAACDSGGTTRPSHVLTAMGLTAADAAGTVRFSFGPANKEGDGAEAARRLLAVLEAK